MHLSRVSRLGSALVFVPQLLDSKLRYHVVDGSFMEEPGSGAVATIENKKVLSGVKPDEKTKFIRQLQKDQNIVAMVGDGINDAAALASAHVGVAMGGGVGAASEVSSIVLMGNRLSQYDAHACYTVSLDPTGKPRNPICAVSNNIKVGTGWVFFQADLLLDALELSRLTMKTVKQNLWWAFAYNMVGIPIAAGMLLPVTGTMLTPSIAGALMGLSSIGVMTNSLLLRFKFNTKQNSADLLKIKDHSNFDFVDQKYKLKNP
ncbi:hypothetical protein TEA_002797 [Camellia sinensis var. sinensis]|uniref:Uncharacterized protein n=1 Tax=Camellia sinensis var. sinensis TaxID=542762 RepID=A0A4V3WKZ9_CAMSN|nr:hypothetical protein TEA_002797 [Camellia sinensis var. sinensis]